MDPSRPKKIISRCAKGLQLFEIRIVHVIDDHLNDLIWRLMAASHGDFWGIKWDDSVQMTLNIYGRIWKILFPRLPVTSSDFQPPNLPNQLLRRCDWKSRDLDWPFWFLVLAASIFLVMGEPIHDQWKMVPGPIQVLSTRLSRRKEGTWNPQSK